jgi:hypothetical protein
MHYFGTLFMWTLLGKGVSVNMMAKRRKIIISSIGEIFDANSVMGIPPLPMVRLEGSNGDFNYLSDPAETIPNDMKIWNHESPRRMKFDHKCDKANNYLTKNESTNGNVNLAVFNTSTGEETTEFIVSATSNTVSNESIETLYTE